MEIPKGKYAWMVKIGEKGQFVIPKEARDILIFSRAVRFLSSAIRRKALPFYRAKNKG